jgi:hypothetical protein
VEIFSLQVLSKKNKEKMKENNKRKITNKDFLIFNLSNIKKNNIENINPVNNVAELFKKQIIIKNIKKIFNIKDVFFSLIKNKEKRITGTAVIAKCEFSK